MTEPQEFIDRWVAIVREGRSAGWLVEYDGGYCLAESEADNGL